MLNKIVVILLCGFLAAPMPCFAASQSPNVKPRNEMAAGGPKRHLTNIVLAGLAGAVLGLSTLSFYGRPQDKLSNIAIGAAIGIIIGTVYSTYQAASEPQDFYNWRTAKPSDLWVTNDSRFDRREFTPRAEWSYTF